MVVSTGKTKGQGFRLMVVDHFTPKGFSVLPVEPTDEYGDNIPRYYPTNAVAVLGDLNNGEE